ncbi:nitrogen regulation protein NR(II) [Bosea sp. RAF48]|uniref:two-component system sensor histidine kinase NtrB n=1 Tax=Bosea sp. RAF48 TaxID=3237480 RepID=UPI003F8EE828
MSSESFADRRVSIRSRRKLSFGEIFVSPSAGKRNSCRFAAVLLATGIFTIDTWTQLEGAVAVLYVLVILIAMRTGRQQDIVSAAILSLILTLISYLHAHGFVFGSPAFRALVSLSAIGMATMLALCNQEATQTLSDQAKLLNLSHDMIFVRNSEGLITFWNRAAEDVYGWSSAEAIGRSADELLATQYPEHRHVIERGLLSTGRWEGELVQFGKSGERLMVASRWALQPGGQGDALGVLETHTDVTERKRTQDALHLARLELAHAARVTTLGELTASIAHEVNQPLMAVVTNAEACRRWLQRNPPDIQEVDTAIGRVISEGQRASEIVTRIRGFLNKEPTQSSQLNVATLVGEAVLLVERELQHGEVELRLALEPNLPPIQGDKVQLQQVLVNILVNGVQAMAGLLGGRHISLQAFRSDADAIAIEISDTGPGIAEGDQERLFDPFFTTKDHGMGMGLAISRTLVEAHGGQLKATSASGCGATFHLTLPALNTSVAP